MDINTRLWAKVPERPSDGCWLWTGKTRVKGYGRIWVGGKQQMVHRVSLALDDGLDISSLPVSQCALHSCDTPLCIRPSHLRWGTKKDNADDRKERGRHHLVAGEANPHVRLSEQQINEIRRRLTEGTRQVDLAREYGVSRQAIWKIQHGRTWIGRAA